MPTGAERARLQHGGEHGVRRKPLPAAEGSAAVGCLVEIVASALGATHRSITRVRSGAMGTMCSSSEYPPGPLWRTTWHDTHAAVGGVWAQGRSELTFGASNCARVSAWNVMCGDS